MFDVFTDTTQRPLRKRSLGSTIVTVAVHTIIVLVVIVIPLLQAMNQLPPVVPTMLAFVAATPAAPPPPPPPPPPAAAAALRPVEPPRTSSDFAAPITAPTDVQPERAQPATEATAGVLGGVEGGVPGGVVGGIVGGIVSPAPPPPPPPPPPPAPAPKLVHIGGQIKAPALLKRVEPVYPDVAAAAQVTGMVILEAVINTEGCVESVKVLRSRHQLLDKASMEALKQWQYSPLILNGIPTPFVLTVTFNFSTAK